MSAVTLDTYLDYVSLRLRREDTQEKGEEKEKDWQKIGKLICIVLHMKNTNVCNIPGTKNIFNMWNSRK